MLSEEQLIPYHASDLTGTRVLCLAPHPDDETLGCGGALALHRNADDPVKVVFLTNGQAGDTKEKMGRDAYVALRRREAEKACRILGVTDVDFWPYADRRLTGSRGALFQLIRLIDGYVPQLVYAPSPMEVHPDHRAACFLLCDAISGCDWDFDVAFYELGQPICINRLVDITPVLKQKNRAVNAYESQLQEQPYGELCSSLNRYRSMTLPGEMTHAEGFSLWNAALIKKTGILSFPFQNPRRYGPDFCETGPLVSIIIRTQDRPGLLANALRSVVQQTYANLEVVLVNDGGVDVEDVAGALSGDMPITYVPHEKKRGRSAAANSGLAAAKGKYLNFLDDDDVFYPDHVETLVRYLEMTGNHVAYSGVSNAYFKGPPNDPDSLDREEIVFNFDYDPDRLLFENYIPIMAILFSREAFQRAKGFSDDLTLFEDWDFWIRMSRRSSFHHVHKITAEYRFYGTEGMASTHRRKYDYDDARARVFDRASAYVDGNAWANYQKNARERAAESPEKPSGSSLNHEALMMEKRLLEIALLEHKKRIEVMETGLFRRIFLRFMGMAEKYGSR
ncbi:MAG: glycosyltransferase [Deltaproteobacteria bacterium]|nr:glycosyltransferase [Deltaproteobacteria bacterium]